MSFDADEEILQDFLVEAGEILEQLSEQLVDLEHTPEDQDLLNSIFRGFHTVKGGAGFLQINPLVECCHVAENIFDSLRNGARSVTPELMDVVLEALDEVNAMFDSVRGGEMPEPASAELIEQLNRFASAETEDEVVEEEAASEEPVAEAPVAAEAPDNAEASDEPEITDAEFSTLLDALDEKDEQAENSGEPEAAKSSGDDITEDEFEDLLDQIHGKGKHGSVESAAEDQAPSADKKESEAPASESADGDLITDSEFEELLDRLHGKGKHSNVQDEAPKAEAPKDQPAQEEVKPAEPVAKAPAEPTKPEPAAKKPEPAKAAEKKPAAAKAKPAAKAAAGKEPRKQDKEPAESTVRVDTKRLDDIMNMVGELVLVRNRLVRLGLESTDESISQAVANLDVVTGDLQTSVMKTRMQPIKKVFGRFPRVVRDLARQLKKDINLEMVGEETDLDKNLVEALADPLVHLVRNSVDHGVEMPAEREESGKSRTGRIVLSAQQEGDHILLKIEDDGKGMNPDMLRQKVVDKGLMDQDAADRLSDNECFNLIFMPGFSTKENISDISGRGVGMDVVKTKITQLNGSVNIDSKPGSGTVISIKVPLTLAIMPTLMVMLKDHTFAFPLVNVDEIFHLDLTKTNIVDGQEVVIVRGKPIPLFYLKRWLVQGEERSGADESAHVVVVSVANERVGFVVDQLIGQEEVVIKPLGKMLQGTAGMAGATITGDGRIALIIDIPSMLQHYASAQHTSAA